MNGWTPTFPRDVQQANELVTVFRFWLKQPGNQYWRNRFFSLLFGGVK